MQSKYFPIHFISLVAISGKISAYALLLCIIQVSPCFLNLYIYIYIFVSCLLYVISSVFICIHFFLFIILFVLFSLYVVFLYSLYAYYITFKCEQVELHRYIIFKQNLFDLN